jgi:hypothetical protein
VTNVDSIAGVYIEPKADTSAKGKGAKPTAPGKQAPKSIVPLPPPPIKPIKP